MKRVKGKASNGEVPPSVAGFELKQGPWLWCHHLLPGNMFQVYLEVIAKLLPKLEPQQAANRLLMRFNCILDRWFGSTYG
jgi:hypothetical protein